MMAGPTIREALTLAPASTTTRPISSLAASTSPTTAGSMLSSTARLTSSMSATLPVSFQYPEMIVEVTLRPLRTSHWIASVISSSPRHDGASPATASCTAGVNRYTPTSARSLFGCCGFSSRPTSWPAPSSSATPNCRGSATEVSMMWASGLAGPELLHQRGDAADDEVVAQVHDEVVVAEELPAHQDRMRQPQRG